jgi:hypothetical protein
MKDRWADEMHDILHITDPATFNTIQQDFVDLLNEKEYKSKITKDGRDILIFIPDEEYTFLKIKYS